jgi:putative addiction module component (TIGR02574 family)
MNAHVDHVLTEVLRLTAEERSVVAASLIDSLEGADEATVHEAWRAELLRRREALRSGATVARPWAEVRARMMAR